MGWNNPPMSWRELEGTLSDRPPPVPREDGPGSRKRKVYEPKDDVRRPDGPTTPYAELHAHSNFSFLDGASSPERLVEQAITLGLHGLALTDHDGFYGAPLFAEIAQKYSGHNLKTIYGAELSLRLDAPQNGIPDPTGSHLLVLARGVEGYHRLAATITDAQFRGKEKGKPQYNLDEVAARGRGHWVVLTGCRKGAVRQALASGGNDAAAAEFDRLIEMFGHDHVYVELIDHGHPKDMDINDELTELAKDRRLPIVATNNVHYADPADYRVATTMAAIRAQRSLAEMNGWLPAWGAACLRTGEEMAERFAPYPGAVSRTVELADELAFDLQKASPRLPKLGIPDDETPMSWLRELVERGFNKHYRDKPQEAAARERIENELRVIGEKDFPGYFVIAHDIVDRASELGILYQGRGSAASSAVCYALDITVIDPVFYDLQFERFISQTRDEEPDIDIDFDSDRREEVIQWVYKTYGRHNAAQVANVISYRPKMAVRDAAKALGYSPGQQDAWSKQIDSWAGQIPQQKRVDHGRPPLKGRSKREIGHDQHDSEPPEQVIELANKLIKAPRHLGIHSGGMILTERPIGEVCPIEPARMEDRTVLQWDKDACEWMGLVKFDLLGLGMLNALNHMIKLTAEHLGECWTLQGVPKEEPAVYDMLCRGDSVGVFQVESRAQIGTLPRLKPRSFYDLAIEIALIRPGPIQGGAVHPYIRRATGKEEVTYPHDDVKPVLERTLGVPLFQEQLMQMAVAIGDCTHDEADLLRRAMGSKRGIERIESIKDTLYQGMAKRDITGAKADQLYKKILSFANFGFAESHALSFAKLVYVSSWFKLHYPAVFLAALVRAQPMGFYSSQSLTGDARRHGVTVLRPDIVHSQAQADLEPVSPMIMKHLRTHSTQMLHDHGRDDCMRDFEGGRTEFVEGTPDPTPEHRRDTAYAVRLGLDSVRGISTEVAERIVKAREEHPFTSVTDLSRRGELDTRLMEALATAGALKSFGYTRREALWNAGYTESAEQLEGATAAPPPPTLPGMTDMELTLADLWATSISPEDHPFTHLRTSLHAHGIRAVSDLAAAEPGRRLTVAGLVTHRQRPGTASGITFLNLEDETGMLNVVCSPGLWRRHARVARNAAGMIIRGILERNDGVINLVADKLSPLEEIYPDSGRALHARHRSRDFH